ncbi:hypothetical protein ACJX0J_028310 [Zea mays]
MSVREGEGWDLDSREKWMMQTKSRKNLEYIAAQNMIKHKRLIIGIYIKGKGTVQPVLQEEIVTEKCIEKKHYLDRKKSRITGAHSLNLIKNFLLSLYFIEISLFLIIAFTGKLLKLDMFLLNMVVSEGEKREHCMLYKSTIWHPIDEITHTIEGKEVI